MTFPSPPWLLRGTLWLSVFVVGPGEETAPRRGVYGVGFADYGEGSTLDYRELVVARLVRPGPTPQVTVTDIWVDSEASLQGARSLWAIPKQLAGFVAADHGRGLLARTAWEAHAASGTICTATFTGGRGNPVRTPFALTTRQPEDGTVVTARLSGTGAGLPCRARWEFSPDGPLAWLDGRRAVFSLRLSSFRARFGG